MKLSIITINLNNLKGLEMTMNSVFSQSFKDFEYLVIDGESTDGSQAHIDKHLGQLKYTVSEPDTGIYNAMNKGIKKAEGEYLLFLNSGDILFHNHTLQEINTYLKGYDIVYGNLLFDFGTHKIHMEYPKKLSAFYLFENYLPHPASFIRKDLFDRVGTYNEQYKICSDWAFFVLAICGHSASYLHIDHTITTYDMHGMSADPSNFPAMKLEKEHFIRSEFNIFFEDFRQFSNLKQELMNVQTKQQRTLLEKIGLIKRKH